LKSSAWIRGGALFVSSLACTGAPNAPGAGTESSVNAPLAAQPNYNAGPADTSHVVVQHNPQVQVSHAESSAPLLLARPAPADAEEIDHAPLLNPHIRPPPAVPLIDPVLQRELPVQAMPTAGIDVFGQGVQVTHPGAQYSPPDTNGVAGPNDFVQTVNADLAIWDKTGKVLKASVVMNSLWAGYVGTNTGNSCSTNNNGDPVVVYDPMADRWFLTQFSLPNEASQPNFQCVAVSKTSDPTGAYWLYDFQYAAFNDYGKFGVWPDAYYATFNNFLGAFTGANICAYDRASMLQGAPATQVCFQQSASVFGALPVSMEGKIPPPNGEPGIFMALGTDDASLDLWTFTADFATPANSKLTGPTSLPVAAFAFPCAGQVRLRCIPQPGTGSDLVESLGDRLMFRLAYRNFGTHESLVLNHSIVAGSTSGVRWYEIRSPTSTPVVFQQGTFAPADSNWRWMGSIAQDQAEDFALGYSVSSTTKFPSIAWAGRLGTDATGTLGQAETIIDVGTGDETGGVNRWGDYSNMTVDPTDDCTFWYTQEYYNTTNAFQWDTRIATVKFPTCAANDFTMSPSPATIALVPGGQNTITVTTVASAGAPEGITLNVQDLPTGVSGSFSPATVDAGTPSTLTLKATAAAPPVATPAPFTIIGTARSALHMATASVTVNGPPSVALTQPVNGAIVAGTVTVAGTASAGSGTTLAALTLSVDGNLVQTGATSPQSYSWDTTALANGSTHTLTATATDADNGTASQSVTVTIKNKPVAAFTAPTNGSTVAGLVSVTATGTPAVGTTLASLAIQIDGGVVKTGAASPEVYAWDTTTYAQGSYTLAAVATDADGPSSTNSITVTVKNGPLTALTSPVNGSTVKGQVTVNATAVPALGETLSSLSIGIDGTSVATGATSPQSYNWDTTTAANGTHALTASATDGDGAASNASVSVTVKNDPTVAITAPANNSTVAGTVAVNVTASPPNGTTLTTLALSIDGAQVKSGAASPLAFSWDTSTLANGSSHTLTATATDADGATATATSTVTVKNNPVVAITSPDGGTTVSGTVAVAASATVPAGTTISSLALSIDGTPAKTVTISPLTYSWDTRPLSNGTTHALAATVLDADGTTATSPTVTVVVNNSTPPDAGHANDGGTSSGGDGGSSNGGDAGSPVGADAGTGAGGGGGCGCASGADASTLSFAALAALGLRRRRRLRG
jgi:hypothetical protein